MKNSMEKLTGKKIEVVDVSLEELEKKMQKWV